MNIVRNNHYRPSRPFFDGFLTRDLSDWSVWTSEGSIVPKVNIVETDNEFLIELAAPGISKEDFLVELDNDMLVIQTDKKENGASSYGLNYTRREFNYHAFKRSFYLPNTVEMEKIEGTYQEGILKLLIPKKEEGKKKPVRHIPIT